MERTRTITWDDTSGSLAAAASMTGLEYMKAIAAGELPAAPIARLIGMTMEEIDEGVAVFSIEPAEFLYNPIGSVHGGVAATMLDFGHGVRNPQHASPRHRLFDRRAERQLCATDHRGDDSTVRSW